jgi:hypothetical protein
LEHVDLAFDPRDAAFVVVLDLERADVDHRLLEVDEVDDEVAWRAP